MTKPLLTPDDIQKMRLSLLWYAIYAQGKTLLAGQLAEWLHRATGGQMIARMYTADGGGDAPIVDKLRDGKLEVLHMGDAKFRFEYMDQITRGWWPDAQGVMKPPTADTWKKVGVRIYEGLTSYSEIMNQTLTEKVEDGQIKLDPNATSKFDRPAAYFMDGSTRVADIPPGLYKLIYQRIKRYVNQSEGLPGIVAWTAKELQVEDKDTKAKQYGPLLVGSKETPQAPGWFQHTLHLDSREGSKLVEWTDDKGQKRKKQIARTLYRINLKQHFDPDSPSVPYLCGLRLASDVSADSVPSFIEDASVDGKPWSAANPFDEIFGYVGILPAGAAGGKEQP